MIFLEFYLPGAILGTIGGILLVASILLVADSENIIFTALYTISVVASVVAIIKYALWKIPRGRQSDSIYSNDSQVGYYASSFDLDAIGKEGIVLSDLKPGGFIEIEGIQLPAISESGYIVKGEHVLVLRGEGDSLIVTKKV
jgi:membrane-bound serine protease (ClpP class)